jgi:hypothetical protein
MSRGSGPTASTPGYGHIPGDERHRRQYDVRDAVAPLTALRLVKVENFMTL